MGGNHRALVHLQHFTVGQDSARWDRPPAEPDGANGRERGEHRMTLLSNEQVRQLVYEEAYSDVVEALEPFLLPRSTVERVAEEAAELAVDREMDEENER